MNRTVPVVPGHPLLGNLLQFREDRLGFLRRIPETYGDVARGRLGLFGVYIVSAPDLAHEVLVEHNDAFIKGFGLSLFAKPLLGDGLLTSERDLHKRQRRLVAPAFMHKRIAGYAGVIGRYADAAVGRIAAQPAVNLSEEMMRLTFEIVGKTLFDADLSSDAKEVGEALTLAMEHLIDAVTSIVPVPPSWPTPANRRARRLIARLDEVVYRMIHERRAEKRDAGDFLSMLLLAQDEDDGSVMTDKQVRDEAMTIVLAGHETTANALAWTFYLLAKHPAVRARLEREVDAALGGRTPTLEDLPRLPYAMQVFKESMRLFPPAYMVMRRATRDVSVGGIDVRKNELVLINIIGMHGRPAYFARPSEFDPDRFAPEAERAMTRHAYLPFGGGPRVCIGNHFALMEGQICLAHLAQHLRFDLAPGSVDVAPEPLVTLRPRGGVHVRVERRAPRDAGSGRPAAAASA